VVLGDLGINQGQPVRLQLRVRPLFVGTHQAAVTRNVDRQNGR
jgi:hypothetical protein